MKKVLLVLLVAFITVVVLAQPSPLYKAVDDFKRADADVDRTLERLQKTVDAHASHKELMDKEISYEIATTYRLQALSKMVSLDQKNAPEDIKIEVHNLLLDKRPNVSDKKVLEVAHHAMLEVWSQMPALPKPRDLHLP